jgi:hypothetical protein
MRHCDGCNTPLRELKKPYPKRAFCSIECACYSGAFSVQQGWLDGDVLHKRHPLRARKHNQTL